MPTPIIKVEQVSKKFILNHEEQGQYKLLRDVLTKKARSFMKSGNEGARSEKEEFYALKDVSFDVQVGDRVGVVGRNGAGKSTLLKILSRITEPSGGRITIRGRIASLLEVGTGFHPELSGRENIFLNGAILGMSRLEIKRKFDEIVAFAEVEKFLDTPVKRYSSGMYVRLAFAVAAHLEPEILIVDEVLAVGDAQFQKKCLGKMEDVSKNEGRTVLFVSHNMDAMRALCNTGILLDKGKVALNSGINDVIMAYLDQTSLRTVVEFEENKSGPGITKIQLNDGALKEGALEFSLYFNSPFEFSPMPGFVVYNAINVPVFGSNPRFHKRDFSFKTLKEGVITARVPDLDLHSGIYRISFWLGDFYKDYDVKRDAIVFEYFSLRNYTHLPDPITMGSVDKETGWGILDK